MLVMCIEDGLTVGNRVHKRGEVFKLTEILERDVMDLSDEKLARKQIRIYGKPYFRKASTQEIISAYRGGQVTNDMMTIQEKRMVFEGLKAEKQRQDAADAILTVEERAKFEEEDAFAREAKMEEEEEKRQKEKEQEEALRDEIEEEEKEATKVVLGEKKSRPFSSKAKKSRMKKSEEDFEE